MIFKSSVYVLCYGLGRGSVLFNRLSRTVTERTPV